MAYQLSDTREVIDRSLFHALRSIAVTAGYLPDIKLKNQVEISALSQLNKTFTLPGVNLTSLYTVGRKFNIVESTANNAEYTVVSSAFTSGNTIITVSQAIVDSTIDGAASIYQYYDDDAGVAAFSVAMQAVISAKGFVIEVFGVGSSRAKYQKKVPRIVLIPNQSLPGALGGNGDPVYTPVGDDPLAPTSYTKHVTPPQTVDFTHDVHIVVSTAEQARVCHGIVAAALPKRGYIQLYNDPDTRFFVEAFSYRNIPNPGDNIMEDVYMYKSSDMYETSNDVSPESIIPITQITADTKVGKASEPDSAINFGDDMVLGHTNLVAAHGSFSLTGNAATLTIN